jgi:tetratricopeptide (TPR) repeat protein
MHKLKNLIAVFFFSVSGMFSQNIDSLWSIVNNRSYNDSVRLNAMNDITWSYMYSNPDTAFILANQELEMARLKHSRPWEAKALNAIAATFQIKGNFPKAIDAYQHSLKIREYLGDKQAIAASLSNIGSIYIFLHDYEKALSNIERSLKIFEEMNNKEYIASAANNLSIIYSSTGNFERALEYSQRSLRIYEESGDKEGIVAAMANIGEIYIYQKNYEKALEYLIPSLKLADEIGNTSRSASIRYDIASVYYQQKKYGPTLEYLEEAKKIATENGYLSTLRDVTEYMYLTYKATNKLGDALKNHELLASLTDSLVKTQNQEEIMRKEMEYEFDKKTAADSIKNAQETKIKDAQILAKNAQIEQDKTQKLALIGGLCLLLVSGGVMFNRYRLISKQKRIIEVKNKETEEQKVIIEEKQKEILSSISYAKRLQEAILPPLSLISKHLPEYFILYKPKDIVAGDFYWFHTSDVETGAELQIPNSQLLIAAADCTGHGVPGAMVSVVCSNALNRTVKEFGMTEPGRILDKTRELVVETFERSETDVKDGMDISLLSIENNSGAGTITMRWSGANNPLWIAHEGQLHEIKPDKQAIGKIENPRSFTTHTLDLHTSDMIYLFTDGYADQFGGPLGKKLKYTQLNNLVLSIYNLPLSEQKKKLEDAFQEWKGALEQVDDVCIIGIRV